METTTFYPKADWLGITEVGMVTLYPDEEPTRFSTFVNPEKRIPAEVVELTGITSDDVKGHSTWAAWARKLDQIAAEHVVIGYNSASFDCVAVVHQNERYGLQGTVFRFSLDAMALPEVHGKLMNAAAAHGISSTVFHRAMADVWVTAQLVEAVAKKYGLAVLDETIGRRPNFDHR